MEGDLKFQCGSGWVVVVGCEVAGVGLVDLIGGMVVELHSSFGGCFCLELGGLKELTSGVRVVSMVDVTDGF